MADRPVIVLPPLLGGQSESWTALLEVAHALGEHWVLVGGQMVFLHQVERHASETRATDDVDVVVDLRAEPEGLRRIHRALVDATFDQDPPGPDGTAHRYRRGLAIIDILAPDHMGARANLAVGAGRTIEVPGSTQAFRRSAIVTVQLGSARAAVRRPDLVGAVVGKAAAATRIRSQSGASRAKHLHDFDSLAKLLGAQDRQTARLSPGERRLIRAASKDSLLSDLAIASLRLLTATQ